MIKDAVRRKRSAKVFNAAMAVMAAAAPGSVWAQSNTRTDQVVYRDDLSSWVLGQTASSTNVDTGVIEFRVEFDPATSVPLRYFGAGTSANPGKLVQTLTYNADGTVATVKDGNNNITTLADWYRGVPRTIQYADSAVESAVVNPLGWITSVTNAVGSKTCYGYDAMGRVSLITQTSETASGICDTSAWNATALSFVQVGATEYGIPAGHWRQTITTGNAQKISYFDALWRPLVTRELDATDAASEALTRRFQRFTYDHEGRVTFASYPGTTDALTTGTWTAYDALGRATVSSQDSELGVLTTTTTYASGFQTHVTNPRNYTTITEYQAYDQPAYDRPTGVTQSAGADTAATEIHRDVFGKPMRIRKRDATGALFVDRHYVYDAHQQLCKAVEPETGATIMDYDGAGNLQWSASGLHTLMGTGDCDTIAGRDSGRKVTRYYDNRNRLQQLVFPDGRGNQAWEYWGDGLPRKITTHNEGLNAAVVENDYVYNRRRLLAGESSSQTAWYAWGLGYGYDRNGSLSTQTYPTGMAISYAPNALGQATQAGSYATGVQYYPNGALKQFTYGNGLTHTMTQNARQLPDRVTGSGLAMDFSYRYDANGNVSQIYDHVPDMIPGSSPKYRLMEYDGLDRLTAAGSAMFGGDHWHRFTYDALDNMKSWKLAWVKDYAEYVYDAQNRLGSIKDSGGATVAGFGYDLQGNLQNKNGQIYVFDYGNRLREVAGREWFYRYDGQGRRVLSGRADGLTVSMYGQSGQLMYYEETGKGNFEQIYLAGSLLAIRNSGVVKFQHTDALGSPIAVTNQAGTVIERNDYEPYGAVIGKPNYQGIGYTGHVQDGATGLTYMQQRYYDPSLGRFLSIDPVAVDPSTGANFGRYWYANNNPYRFVDPDGRAPCIQGSSRFGDCRGGGGLDPGGLGGPCDLRPCGGGLASQTASAQASRRLEAEDLPYPSEGWGGTESKVREWGLSRASSKGGFVVQELTITAEGSDKNGVSTKRSLTYWEAWLIPAGSTTPVPFARDTFRLVGEPKGMEAKGRITWSGKARFYEGLVLPSTFFPNNPQTKAGSLPSTTVNPRLGAAGATNSVNVVFSISWP